MSTRVDPSRKAPIVMVGEEFSRDLEVKRCRALVILVIEASL